MNNNVTIFCNNKITLSFLINYDEGRKSVVKDSLSSVRSIERGIRILECFKQHMSLSLTEIPNGYAGSV